ncbi:MAG: FAD-binding oxidoreductase [Candidatus Methylomirabilales bacterium]
MRKGRTKARLAARRNVTEALAVFTFIPLGRVGFLAGQYAALGLRERGKLLRRDYSIASSPYQDFLEFFIERVEDGQLTARLFQLEPGVELLVHPPQGGFSLDRESGRPHHLMVATVTGIAPFMSMVRSLVIEERRGAAPEMRVTLLQGASFADEFGYDAELRRIAASHPWLVYIPAISRPSENPGWQGETGRVEGLIEKTLDSLQWTPRDTTVYLCGHPGMIEKGRNILADRGFHGTQVREEQYWDEEC